MQHNINDVILALHRIPRASTIQSTQTHEYRNARKVKIKKSKLHLKKGSLWVYLLSTRPQNLSRLGLSLD
jgi:hypothetical protein